MRPRAAARAAVHAGILLAVLTIGAASSAWLARPAAAAPAAAPAGGAPFLPGAGSKEPISIDAGRLDYFDKEQKLVYTGDVVAVQGESTLKASVLTIFLQKNDPAAAGQPAAAAPAGAPPGAPASGSQVKRMEAQGPVTLISKDQVGTGDHAVYDKEQNKVFLTGNVTLTQGANVTQGDRLVYDMTSGQAQVFAGSTSGRVKSVFTPGSGTDSAKPAPVEAKTKDKTSPPPKRKPVAATRGTTHAAGAD